jgi:hypothetical protein
MAKEMVPAISAETRQVKAKLGLLFRKRASLTAPPPQQLTSSRVRRAEAGAFVTQIFPASFYCCVVALTRSRFDDSFCACSFSIFVQASDECWAGKQYAPHFGQRSTSSAFI